MNGGREKTGKGEKKNGRSSGTLGLLIAKGVTRGGFCPCQEAWFDGEELQTHGTRYTAQVQSGPVKVPCERREKRRGPVDEWLSGLPCVVRAGKEASKECVRGGGVVGGVQSGSEWAWGEQRERREG